MKNRKGLIYLLLPLQILVLLLSPRFGWSIHKFDAGVLAYEGTSYKDGALHCVYENDADTVDISYGSVFSKKFNITVNETEKYTMEVKIDGETIGSEENILLGIANDIVWKDTLGIFYWRYILTIALTLISIKAFKRAGSRDDQTGKALCVGAVVVYVIAILVSLRVVF